MIVAFPSFCGALFVPLLPQSIFKAEAVGLFNFYLEYLIRNSTNSCVQKLRKSLVSGSVTFAILNVLIMCGMLKARCPNFWFSKFKYSKNTKDTKNSCDKIHSDLTCLNYFYKVKSTISWTLF